MVGQMPPSALTPSGQPKMKSSEMCHVGDDGDEHERGDGGSHAEHAEHDGVARVLGDALGLTVGERALDALGGRDLLGLSAVGDAAALHVGIV